MADGFDTLEFILSCQICLEDFTETGDLVPRIFPCSHTLCEGCLRKLIRNDSIECPECRKKHKVVNGVWTFPQNKYIIGNVRKQAKDLKGNPKEDTSAKCEIHGKELVLFCNHPECCILLCLKCVKDHYGHNLIEREEKEKENLCEDIDSLMKTIQGSMEKLKAANADADNHNKECKEKLVALRDKIVATFNTMIRTVEETLQSDKEGQSSLQDHLDLLINIKDNINSENTTKDELRGSQETVDSITESVKVLVSGLKGSKFYKLEEPGLEPEDVRALCPKLVLEERPIGFPVPGVEIGVSIFGTVQLKIPVDSSDVWAMCALDNDRVVVLEYSQSTEEPCLVQYSVSDGRELSSVPLYGDPRGITMVRLGIRGCLAVSFSSEKKIEFRDCLNLDTVVLNHRMEHPEPWELCASTPSTLVFEDWSEFPRRVVTFLNCSTSKPYIIPGSIELPEYVNGMCFVKHDDQKLLVCTSSTKIQAFRKNTKQLEWSVKGKLDGLKHDMEPRGATTDGRGHIYVCDKKNNCIQIFSTNGQYLGSIKEGNRELITIEPSKICWHEGTNSVVISHEESEQETLSVIRIL